MKNELEDFVKFSLELAYVARKVSLFYFKKKIKVKSKNRKKFDPVTIADIKIQNKLNRLIIKRYPEHSILGEEESFIKNGSYEWCIDPIDGTQSYIQGVPLWGTLISLSRDKKIILGLADIPALDEMYIGYSNASYKIKNNVKKKLKVRNTKILSDAILNTTSPYVFANKKDQNSFEKLSNKTRSTRLGGDCYSYCLLADGHVDIVVESGLKPWDIRALEPIINNAGGLIKTWEDKEIYQGGRIIACNNKKIFNLSRSILVKKKPRSK